LRSAALSASLSQRSRALSITCARMSAARVYRPLALRPPGRRGSVLAGCSTA